ncbi:hypothetical protein M8J75_005207 [Diaphorina citri]|nr:hypothetical protein M8J75_005207 [Diaphorina citri]
MLRLLNQSPSRYPDIPRFESSGKTSGSGVTKFRVRCLPGITCEAVIIDLVQQSGELGSSMRKNVARESRREKLKV